MRRIALPLTLAALLAAAPAALGVGGDDRDGPSPKTPRTANLVLEGCVIDDADRRGVDLDVLEGNRTMEWLLGDEEEFSAALGRRTRVWLSPAAREDHGSRRARGSFRDLWAGDRVVVRWNVRRGTALDDLPAARRVVNLGPSDECLPEDEWDDWPWDEEGGDDPFPDIPLEGEPPATDPVPEADPAPAPESGPAPEAEGGEPVAEGEVGVASRPGKRGRR